MKTRLLSLIALTAIAALRLDAAPLDSNAFTFQSSKVKQRVNLLSGLTHDYGHDSVRRLVQSAVSSNGVPAGQILYTLDSACNRVQVSGGPDAGLYGMDATLPDPGDTQVNQYTITPFDTREYDRNGNLIAIDRGLPTQRILVYDFRNRLVSYTDTGSGVSTTYRYDVFGRRIEKSMTLSGQPAVTTRYLFNGPHEIEERGGGGAVQATFIRKKDGGIVAMKSGGQTYYFHRDGMRNTVALTDATGAAVERYDFGDFGQPHFYAPDGTELQTSAFGNAWLFGGSFFDGQTGFLQNGARCFEPRTGRPVNGFTLSGKGGAADGI